MRMCNVVAFAGGVLAGGIIALLFAPKKGMELRADIKERMGDMKKRVSENMCGDSCQCGDNCKCGDDCRCGDSVSVTVEE